MGLPFEPCSTVTPGSAPAIACRSSSVALRLFGISAPSAGASLADPPVDALSQQVGVPAVTGVLLDPVHHQLPNRDAARAEALAEVRVLGEGGVGGGLLARQGGVGGVDLGLIA